MARSTYEASAHGAQMAILRTLLLSDSASFSELTKATKLTSDHANFHIKKLVSAGYIQHLSRSYGKYQLTRSGKEYANRMDTDEELIEKQPKLSVVLDIVHADGRRLQQQRLKQPYYGYWGRPTGKIRWGETMVEAAERELLEETGLQADFTVLGFMHKLDYDETGALLEDKYFCVMRGVNPRGELIKQTDGQMNEWMHDDEYNQKEKNFGTLSEVEGFIESNSQFVFEKKYIYDDEAY